MSVIKPWRGPTAWPVPGWPDRCIEKNEVLTEDEDGRRRLSYEWPDWRDNFEQRMA